MNLNYFYPGQKEAEMVLNGYDKISINRSIKDIELKKPADNRQIRLSNLLIKTLRENKIFFLSVMTVFVIFAMNITTLFGSFIFCQYLILMAILHKVFNKKKIYPYLFIFISVFSCLLIPFMN